MSSLRSVLDKYRYHPQFLGIELESVNQRGALDDTPLHIACNTHVEGAPVDDVQELIEHGADVNAQGDLGYTPLHLAITYGSPKLVEILLNAGARTDIADEDGQTVADAAPYCTDEIRELLEQASRTS